MNIVKHKCYEYSGYDNDHGSSDICLIKKQNNTEDKKDDGHKSSSKSIKSISDIYSVDDRDSSEESEYRIEQSERYFACDRPQIDIIDPQSTKKPSTDKCRKNYHTDKFSFCTQSLNSTISLYIEEVIYESYESHTKETKQQDIGFLSIEQSIVDKSHIFQNKRKSYHKSHNYQKNTASHSWGTLFMFVELGKNSGFFSSN